MGFRHLGSALLRVPCTCALSSRPRSFASPLASTSHSTLDDPLPDWQDLAPAPLRRTKGSNRPKAKAPQLVEHGDRPDKVVHRPKRPPPPVSATAPSPDAPRLNRDNLRRPPNERTQVSPFLPLFTRERNHLLSNLRRALSSRPVARIRPFRHARTPAHAKRHAWNADAAWLALARVLRYPDDIPSLPHSHFPSSTRAPLPPSYALDADTSTPGSSGFFTAARLDGTGGTPAAGSATGEPTDASGRRKIALTLPELRRAFAVFASSRPRTRTGLHRLLVVAELIAQQQPPLGALGEPHTGAGADAGTGLHQLRGGGAGLRDQDWRALLLFVGASMRASRPAHEVKHALDLFSHWLKLQREACSSSSGSSSSEPMPTRGRRRRGDAGSSSSSGGSSEGQRQRMFNAVLFVAGRAHMWELFEQVLRRMAEEGVVPDGATVVELMRKEDRRGAPVAAAWRIFEDALAARVGARGEGLEEEQEGADALWAAMAWVLARRGLLDDAMRLYEAMRAGERVPLDSLRPTQELDPLDGGLGAPPPPPSSSSSRPGLVVQPPKLTDRVYSSLLKAFAYRGDLSGALRILRDVSTDPASGVPPAVHHFVPLFHAFAHHGVAPFGAGARAYDVNPTTLRGTHLRAYAVRRDASPLAALTRTRTPTRRAAAGGGGTDSSSGGSAGGATNPFTLDALSSLLSTFLSLPAPSSASHPALPFSGARTAPSSKDLWWVLFAFDKLSGGDSELVVDVYDALERKFRDEAGGWTGWREDKRTPRLVRMHRDRAEERRRRWEELQ
ncbi:Serine/arginine repetitive matrix 2, isoform CRA a [Rhodotorula diobovata]|uniref:Serine/arginine repetitive matrix 2, isoform CRA a n=1 Tax=Rhodotorula diobovata TaxID=5288 RepID=A0A5C5FMG5_9BASI|nr:Serine/arginine repetitive matrix 2, isoform CRA a [Rhodotorula diobovata]